MKDSGVMIIQHRSELHSHHDLAILLGNFQVTKNHFVDRHSMATKQGAALVKMYCNNTQDYSFICKN